MYGTMKGLFSLMNEIFFCLDQKTSKIAEFGQVNPRKR